MKYAVETQYDDGKTSLYGPFKTPTLAALYAIKTLGADPQPKRLIGNLDIWYPMSYDVVAMTGTLQFRVREIGK